MAVDVTQPVYPPATQTPISSAWGKAVSDTVVQHFIDAGDRDAKWINPPVGSISTLGNTGRLDMYRAGAWRQIAEVADIPGPPGPLTKPRSTVGHYNGAIVEVPTGDWYEIQLGIYQPIYEGETITLQVTGLVGCKESGGHVYGIPMFNNTKMDGQNSATVGNLPGNKSTMVATSQMVYNSPAQCYFGLWLLPSVPSTIETITWNIMSYPP
jgi:hypothetical protein